MTVHIEEKLNVMSRLQKGECFFDVWHNVLLIVAYLNTWKCWQIYRKCSVRTWSVCVASLPQYCQNEPYQKLRMWVSLPFYCIRNK